MACIHKHASKIIELNIKNFHQDVKGDYIKEAGLPCDNSTDYYTKIIQIEDICRFVRHLREISVVFSVSIITPCIH